MLQTQAVSAMETKKQLCRICLQHDEPAQHISVFDEDNDFGLKIFLISGVQVNWELGIRCHFHKLTKIFNIP